MQTFQHASYMTMQFNMNIHSIYIKHEIVRYISRCEAKVCICMDVINGHNVSCVATNCTEQNPSCNPYSRISKPVMSILKLINPACIPALLLYFQDSVTHILPFTPRSSTPKEPFTFLVSCKNCLHSSHLSHKQFQAASERGT
jgi:hypothetical protein